SKTKSGGFGNSTFGAGYEADLTYSASKSPLNAQGEAKLFASATLFSKKITLATVDASGALSNAQVDAYVNVVGMDLFHYTKGGLDYQGGK
ncbi:hypothetical protein ABTL65_19510, partial [Acinetobacter baumannii]